MELPKKRPRLLLLLILAVATWTALSVTNAEACATGQVCASHVFGITRGETARAYGINTGEENGVIAIIRYADVAGNLLAEQTLRIDLGHVAFFDLNADNLDFGTEQRLVIHVDISIQVVNARKTHKPDALSALELFDNASGETLFLAEDRRAVK